MKRFSVPILGADKREFDTSIEVAIVGLVLIWILLPPIGHSSMPNPNYVPIHLHRAAWHFVVAFISLLCAVNAFRDKDNKPNKRLLIVVWCIVLCLWIFFSLTSLSYWWGRLPPLVKPPWLQGPDI
jgi:hypothetical protein